MLSQWFEIITTCITLACLCRCPCYRSPESNSIFRNERRNRHVCRCCIINRQRLRKILRFHRHYYSLPETTNAANYATTRAANRTSTTRLLLTIIYYFFPPLPPFWNVSRTIVTFIIDPALSGKKRVCNVSTSVSKPTCQFVVINLFIFPIDRGRKWESFGKSNGEINLLHSNGALSIRIMVGWDDMYALFLIIDNNRELKI